MINVRQKGAQAERDIADDLNVQIYLVYKELGLSYPSTPIVQRNQNQTAVGGKDLVGTFGFAIEVKRQEQLSINTWWTQCVISARALNEVPVLLFKQHKLPWRCILETSVAITSSSSITVRSEISYEDFKKIFNRKVYSELSKIPKPEPSHVQQEGLFTAIYD